MVLRAIYNLHETELYIKSLGMILRVSNNLRQMELHFISLSVLYGTILNAINSSEGIARQVLTSGDYKEQDAGGHLPNCAAL
jgi:hypothetical protein